jgi:hypothetical protein
MKQITLKWLEKNNACSSGIEFFKKLKTTDPVKLFEIAMKKEKYQEINWTLSKYFNKKQRVMYAIFAAEQVIDIYEKKYPMDNNPRKAIEAAKKYVKNPNKKNAAAAYNAAAYNAAAYNAAAYAAYAAAAAAAYADDTVYTVYAAAYAAYTVYAAAYADDTVKKQMMIKILNYGFNLIKGVIK